MPETLFDTANRGCACDVTNHVRSLSGHYECQLIVRLSVSVSEIGMGKCCCAPGCSNRFTKNCGLSFYRFPTDRERKRKWISALRREPDWEPTVYSWLCSAHFVSGAKSNDKISPDFIPSLFSRVDHLAKRKAEDSLSRYERAAKRARQRKEAEKENREKQRLRAADSSLVESAAAPFSEPLESLALTSECCSAPSDRGKATSSSVQ